MTERRKQIPQVERPQEQPESQLERLEEDTLDKQAKSAPYRAAFEHNQHLRALNKRIDVLQAKLDKREDELHIAIPRVAELEQAQRTSKVGAIVEAAGVGCGALLLSIASFTPLDEWYRFVCIGAGISASVFALFAKLLLAAFGWPPKTTNRD